MKHEYFKRDPNTKIVEQVHFKALDNHKVTQKVNASPWKSSDATTPRLYQNHHPKVHKPHILLRPIVSVIGSHLCLV